jgi:Kef-type K+ transport system membrane component KefB
VPNLTTLVLQIAVIIVVARAVGILFRQIGQPQVMGEMVAGILLGPSLLVGSLPLPRLRFFRRPAWVT